MNVRQLLSILLLTVSTYSGFAQFNVSKVKPSSVDPMMKDSVKQSNISNDYFSQARWDAERKRIRKERNMVEFNSAFQMSQNQFENWAGGGDNTFSGRATLFFRHEHKREKLTVDYKLEARYGINIIDRKPYKNEDEFKFNFLTKWQIGKTSWSYATTANLRSQFSKGYKSRTDKTRISNFMAPGFVDVTVGFNFRKPNSPFSLTVSPLAGSITLVLDKELSEVGINGVEKGKTSKGQLGPSIRMNYDKEFAKKIFRFRSDFYSFTNIKTTPTARWENALEVRATKFFTTTIYALAYYDKYANTPKPQKLQLNYSFSIGLAYRFRNK